jgi:hypothetical protein
MRELVHYYPFTLVSRNNHRVDEPLGFLTNFFLNKRSRVLQNSAVASVGVEWKKRAVESGASTSPRYRSVFKLQSVTNEFKMTLEHTCFVQKHLLESLHWILKRKFNTK